MAKNTSKNEVLYLKYRSQTLSEIIGQDHITKTLLSALSTDRASHAYIFSGPRGTGKTSIARILAKAVNCANPKGGEPCNKCESCIEITAGKSLDVSEIDAASNRGIDEMRELRDKIKFTPAKSKYKVFIIDEVHMLTREAFNALLKTLEEPPAHALFILATTEVHKVPETILSRCQRFDFKRIKMTDLIDHLALISKKEKLDVGKDALELIAANASGALRDAINLLDQASAFGNKINLASLQSILGLADIDAVYRLVDSLIAGDTTGSIELINDLLERGYDLTAFNKKLIEHLRHILILKVSNEEGLIEVTLEQLEKIKKQASALETEKIIMMINAFLESARKTNVTNLPQLPLEMATLEVIDTEFEPKKEEKKIKDSKDNEKNKNNSKSEKISETSSKKAESQKNNSQEFKNVINQWDKILDKTKSYNHSINAFLKASKPKDLKEDTIFLDFIYSFHREKINEPKNRDIVEKSIKEVTGESYKIRCQFNPDGFKADKKYYSEEKDALKEALEVFGGEIVE